MSSVIKGNRPLRIFSGMVLVVLVIAQFMEQVDLTQISFLWLIIAMAINAFQASFTGFCPMFKNANGECVACGVACDKPADKNGNQDSTSACCSGVQAGCCDDTSCCPDEKDKKTVKSATSQAGCEQPKESTCCSGGRCSDANTDNADQIVIKVLGSGCKNCDTTAKLIEQIAAENQLAIKIVKVEDVADIASYGVMSTPAVVMDEEVVHSGSIPTKQQIQTWLSVKS